MLRVSYILTKCYQWHKLCCCSTLLYIHSDIIYLRKNMFNKWFDSKTNLSNITSSVLIWLIKYTDAHKRQVSVCFPQVFNKDEYNMSFIFFISFFVFLNIFIILCCLIYNNYFCYNLFVLVTCNFLKCL